jgi:hypothetical protein
MQTSSEDIIILRALMNVTQPKFTLSDTLLFGSITSDLFPKVQIPESDYAMLKAAIEETCDESNL